MSKRIKLVTGIILLIISVIYLLITCAAVLRIREAAREDAFLLVAGNMIAVDCIESKNLGRTVVTEWGETFTTESSTYEFYRLAIQVENKGHSHYFGNPAEIFTISGMFPEDVGRVIYPKMYDPISYATTPMLPGKTSTTAVFYVEVSSDVHNLKAVFTPGWKKDEESLNIRLD